jgi:hypothetical protein
MEAKHLPRGGFVWLELLLALGLVALLFQLVPSLWWAFLSVIDMRNWSSGVWIGLNVAIVMVLSGIRYWDDLKPAFKGIMTPTRDTKSTRRRRENFGSVDADYEARARRDAEWRERARNRLPFT